MTSLPIFISICAVVVLVLWLGLVGATYAAVARIVQAKSGSPITIKQFLRFCLMHVVGYGVMIAGLIAGLGILFWTANAGAPRLAIGLPVALGGVIIGQACLYVGNRSLQVLANSLRR